jgi:hypothetical protein
MSRMIEDALIQGFMRHVLRPHPPKPKPRPLSAGEQGRRADGRRGMATTLRQLGWREHKGRWFAPGTSKRTSPGVPIEKAFAERNFAAHRRAS